MKVLNEGQAKVRSFRHQWWVVAWCRERSDGLYSTVSYLLSKMVEELVVILFVSLVVSACIFFAVGFHGQYILFWLTYLITISIGMGARLHSLFLLAQCSSSVKRSGLPTPIHTVLPMGSRQKNVGRRTYVN